MKDLENLNVENNNGNDDEMEKKWDAIKEDYISKYSELRKEDLSYERGGISGMFERIGRKRGRTLYKYSVKSLVGDNTKKIKKNIQKVMKIKNMYNSKITKEDKKILGDKTGNLRNDGGDDRILKNRKKEVDFVGEDLDVPGRKLPKNKTNKTLKDEENQLYSLGEEENENLEQDYNSTK